jgi:ABC-type multidrug transport system fused ATPase/permease subunit
MKANVQNGQRLLTDAALAVVMRIVFMMPIMMLCFNVATVGVLWLGGRMVMGGGLLIGDLSSFLTYIFQILMSVMMMAMSLLQLSRAQRAPAHHRGTGYPAFHRRRPHSGKPGCPRPGARWSFATYRSNTSLGSAAMPCSPG